MVALASQTAVPRVSVIGRKRGADVLRPFAQALGLPLHLVPVQGVATPTQSGRVQLQFQTGSVAEAAALTAAGRGARLVVLRVTSPDGMATCAVAEGEGP